MKFSRGRVYLDQERDIAILTLDNITADNPPLSLAAALPRQAEESRCPGDTQKVSITVLPTAGLARFVQEINCREMGKEHGCNTMPPFHPGSSGGPLVNKQGGVVGMNTWFLAGDEETGGAQNLNFAISAEDIRDGLQKANRRPGVPIGSEW